MTKDIQKLETQSIRKTGRKCLTLKDAQKVKGTKHKRAAIHGRVICGDISGSMSGAKMNGLKDAYHKVWAPGVIGIVFGSQVYEIEQSNIAELTTMGATAMMAGLQECWSRNPEQIILISDGEPTDAQEGDIIEVARGKGVRIDTIGISDGGGYGYSPEFLRALADATGGTFTDCGQPIELGEIVEFLLTQGGSSSLEEGQVKDGGIIQL